MFTCDGFGPRAENCNEKMLSDQRREEGTELSKRLGLDRHLIPLFWGDLGKPADSVDDILPYRDWLVQTTNGSRDDSHRNGLARIAGELREALFGLNSDAAIELLSEEWKQYTESSRHTLIGHFYDLVRKHYLTATAEFMGDLFFYQNHKAEIHAHIWECLRREAPGYGLKERPISVIAHSLGGVIIFDMAVAGQPALHLENLITCSSQAPFFHVIGCSPATLSAYQKGAPTTLPSTICHWSNFFVPLDPWAYLAAPAFRLRDGAKPRDIEVHSGGKDDKLFDHGVGHYWGHQVVIDGICALLCTGKTP